MLLNALARAEEFDELGRLAVVAEGLAMPWRERRELGAQIYLTRGFVDSAADEWVSRGSPRGVD